MAQARATIDHDTIRRWVEARGGHPAHVHVKGSEDDPGVLVIDYPELGAEGIVDPISWDDFFEAFEDGGFAFLYRDEEDSRVSKLVPRDGVNLDA